MNLHKLKCTYKSIVRDRRNIETKHSGIVFLLKPKTVLSLYATSLLLLNKKYAIKTTKMLWIGSVIVNNKIA